MRTPTKALFITLLAALLTTAPALHAATGLTVAAGSPPRVTFLQLGTPLDGNERWCTNCTAGTSPCTGGGTGAFAYRVGSAWTCAPASAAGTGTVTSVGLAGTANQITVTGTSPITTSGSWTLSFPAGGVTLPGTTTGTFSGSLTATTVQTSGNVGIGVAPSGTTGALITATSTGNQATIVKVSNADASGTAAEARFEVAADTATLTMRAHGTGRTVSRFGSAIGGWTEVLVTGGNGLKLGTSTSTPLILGTANIAGMTFVAATAQPSLNLSAVTAGTLTLTNSAELRIGWNRVDIANADVTALGASTTGDITLFTLPAKMKLTDMAVIIDTPDTSSNALTIAVGRTSASFIDYIVASDAKAAANTVYGDASGERGTNLTGYDLPSYTGTTAVKAHFIKTTTNLSTVTGFTAHVDFKTELVP